jgi:hypothetical protein
MCFLDTNVYHECNIFPKYKIINNILSKMVENVLVIKVDREVQSVLTTLYIKKIQIGLYM